MNSTLRQVIGSVVILIVLILIGAGSSKLAQHYNATPTINDSVRTAPSITYNGQEGKTVLDLLQAGHQVDTTNSSAGVFVKAIDGVKQTDNSFWLYYINDKPGSESADKAPTHTGDMITWRYVSL